MDPQLWERIQEFNLDGAGTPVFSFEQRLARENA